MQKFMHKLRVLIVSFFKTVKDYFISEESTNLKISLATLWTSCDNLPVKIFYEILKTENLNLLVRSGNANQKKLSSVWADILDEYWQLTDKAKYLKNLRLAKSLIQKRNEYTTILGIVTLAEAGAQVAEYLKYWKLKNIAEAKQRILVLKTNINFALAKLNKDDDQKAAYNFYKDLAMLEQVLNRSIDGETITVSYWIELNKLAKEISKSKK